MLHWAVTFVIVHLLAICAGENAVVSLDADSYDAFIQSHDNVFMKFMTAVRTAGT